MTHISGVGNFYIALLGNYHIGATDCVQDEYIGNTFENSIGVLYPRD